MHAVEQSQGIWKPSPGLIYPLLGRLLDEGLIEETILMESTKLTKKGKEPLLKMWIKINDIVKNSLMFYLE